MKRKDYIKIFTQNIVTSINNDIYTKNPEDTEDTENTENKENTEDTENTDDINNIDDNIMSY